MISSYFKECLKKYCNEDITKIEGYYEALNDKSDTKYDCHHRYEVCLEDGNLRPNPIGRKILIDTGYYYNRPANELIILSHSEHQKLHMSHLPSSYHINMSEATAGRKNGMYGKLHSEETKAKQSLSAKNRKSHKCIQLCKEDKIARKKLWEEKYIGIENNEEVAKLLTADGYPTVRSTIRRWKMETNNK